MDKDFKIKYHTFVYTYYTSIKICLNGMMKRKYNEKIYHFLWRAAKKLGGVLCDDICFGRFMRFRFQLKAGSEGLWFCGGGSVEGIPVDSWPLCGCTGTAS